MAVRWHLWCEMAPIAATLDLNLLRVFAMLYETGSFSGAATRLGVPRSTVSRAIAALEDALGEQLVHRTTRTVTITEDGKELYDRVSPSISALGAAVADRPAHRDEPTGLLKVTATPDIASVLLAEAAVRFTSRYPGTQVQIAATTRLLDLVRDGVDLAFRISNPKQTNSSLITQRLGTFTWQLFAAPTYLARRGMPRTQADLADHDWIGFKDIPLAPFPVPREVAEGRIVTDDVFVSRELVRRGGGLGGLPGFIAAEDLKAGTLVPVLPKLTLVRAQVNLVQPSRKHVASRVTAFKELVVELLRQRPLG